jgi:DNA-binding transcriptional LysR family regulator
MQVRRLEEAVGKPLFERTGRKAVLTTDGEVLLGYARRILRIHEEAVASLREPEMVGSVRLGTPDDYVSRFVPDILLRFAQGYPQVQVDVHCEPSSRLTGMLENGELDLALVTSTSAIATGEVVREEKAVWATSERHLAHEADPLPLALFPSYCIFREWAIKSLGSFGRPYRLAYSSPSFTGILAAVSAGLAVTVTGESLLPAGVRALSVTDGFPLLPTFHIVLQRAPGAHSRAIECLANHITEGFRTGSQRAA